MTAPRSEPGREELARALAAFLREEFQTPVVGLRALIDTLAEDAAAVGLDLYDDDLSRMGAAGERLFGLVSSMLDGPARADDVSQLRHDLRTPVTAILGYGELIAEEARERGDTPVMEPLADVLEAATRLLREFDRLIAFNVDASEATRVRADDRPVPDVLRKAVEAVRRLTRHEAPPSPSPTGRILVVDDNAAMRDLASRRLARDGHAVTVCESGAAALDLAASGTFDLMLLDLMMPGLSGLDVLAALRAVEATRSLPVVVMSALDEADAAVRCIEAGADDYLTKPLNETLLRARIGSSLERKFLRDREQAVVARLRDEQARSEGLLRNVLPEAVVARLNAGESVIADQFEAVTVLFCDLVGFTALSTRLDTAAMLDLLNAVFSAFDDLAEVNGLEKIKTIGDAYMVVGGLVPGSADHARRVVRMACGMPEAAARAMPGLDVSVRIGVDTGPAAAGIIGRRKFFYDVWGDTVNTASRLETLGEPGRVHVSEATRRAIGDAFTCLPRPLLDVKGKGSMQTYFVSSRSEDGPDLPSAFDSHLNQ